MKKLIVSIILILSLVSLISPALGAISTSGKYMTPDGKEVDMNIKIEKRIIPQDFSQPSALKIVNPYAAAGQVVVAQIVVTNEGGSYPFNYITLPPDQFGLMVAVDKGNEFVTCQNQPDLGKRYWEVFRNDGERLYWWLAIQESRNNYAIWQKSVSGRTCISYDATKSTVFPFPASLGDVLNQRLCGGGGVNSIIMWDCLKIVDDYHWQNLVKTNCPNGVIDESCTTTLNDAQKYISKSTENFVPSDTITCMLTSDPVNQVDMNPKSGTKPNSMVRCGIGPNGLKPGESATFSFYIMIPADTPLATKETLDAVQFGTEPTVREDCSELGNPSGCHGLYVAVYPLATQTVMSDFSNWLTNAVSCGGATRYFLDKNGFDQCWASKTSAERVVGEPIRAERGIFFIFGPALGFSVNMMLLGALVAGTFGGVIGRRVG